MKWLIPFLMVLLTGCTMRPEFSTPEPDDEAFAPPVLDYSLPEASDGSLYRNNYMMTLFQDRRAYRVGDILTIVLDEETQSSKKANTQFSKDSEVGISAPVFGNYTADNLSASVDASRGFDGSSQSSQGNKLKGAITVTVNAVLPNGVLRIRGEKWLRLNQGDEFIRLSGIVRVDDINRLNQVSSQRIGDARITYSGRGALADSNSAGWLTQFFTSPWMPF